MYKIQPYTEEVELMKRGRKGKQKKTIRTKGVNITNVINVSRGGGGRRRPPAFSPAVNVPFSNLFRPQINEPRSVAVTSASYGEQNNNILASFQKSQEISEGKLKAQIDDMGSRLEENIMNMGRYILTAPSVDKKIQPTQPIQPLPEYTTPVRKTIRFKRPPKQPKGDDEEKKE